MERRREPRIACYQRATLTLLSGERRTIPCHAIDLSGQGMRIVLDEPVPANTPISIEIGDWMALGEVCYSRREYTHYAVGLELDQVVMGLRELDALRRSRLNERTPPSESDEFSLVLNVAEKPLA
jgi:hypothetical protein